MEPLIYLGIALAIIAVLGHGIWVAAAAILRVLFGTAGTLSHGDLETVAKFYRTLYKQGTIDAAKYTQWVEVLEAEYRRYRWAPPPRAVTAPDRRALRPAVESLAAAAEVSVGTCSPQPAGAAVDEAQQDEPVLVPVEATVVSATAAPPTSVPRGQRAESLRPALQPAERNVPSAVRSPFDFEDEEPRTPRRPWSEVLQSFMQEKNIRWGELVSGILIVGSAVGLVVSLRQELQRTIPYFPALLFMLITGAIFGAGLYSLKKWKLETTSRGVLTIGLLLVPLNVFAACLLARGTGRASGDPAFLAALVLGLLGYGAMTWAGTRPLFRRENWWAVAAAILGCAFWQIVLHRGLSPASGALLANVLTAPLVLSYVAGNAAFARRQPPQPLDNEQPVLLAEQQLLAVGLTCFAVLCGLAMAMMALGGPQRMLDVVAPGLVPLLALGWLLPGGRLIGMTAPRWAAVAGLSLVVLSALHVPLALVGAWPQPAAMLLAALLGTVVLSGCAAASRLAAFTAAAATSLTIAALLALHLLAGSYAGTDVAWAELHGRLLLGVTSSVGLAIVSALYGAIAAVLNKRRPAWLPLEHVRAIAGVAAAAGVASVVVAIVASILAASGTQLTIASAVLVWQALLLLLAGSLLGRPALLRLGHGVLLIALLQITLVHADRWTWLDASDSKLSLVVVALGLHACLASTVSLLAWWGRGRSSDAELPRPERLLGRHARLISSEFAAAALLVSAPLAALAVLADLGRPSWLAVDFGVVSLALAAATLARAWPGLFQLWQASLYITALATAAAVARHYGLNLHWSAPRYVALQLAVLAAAGAVWNLAFAGVAGLQRRASLRVDVAVTCAVSVAAFLLALASCAPGVLAEFGWHVADEGPVRLMRWLDQLAADQVLWWVFSALAAALLLGQLDAHGLRFREALAIACFGALLTWASRFAPQYATASAMRWLSAGGLLSIAVGSVAVGHWSSQLRTHLARRPESGRFAGPLWCSILCSFGPLVGLMMLAMVRGVSGGPLAGPSSELWWGRIGAEANYAVPLLLSLAALQAIAWDRRTVGFARAGTVVLLVLVAAWVLAALFAPVNFDRPLFMTRYCQMSALILCLYTAGWLALEQRERTTGSYALRALEVGALSVMTLLVVTPALTVPALALSGAPRPAALVAMIARPLGWIAAAAVCSLCAVRLRGAASWSRSLLGAVGWLVLFGLASAYVAAAWPAATWLPLRVTLLGLLGLAMAQSGAAAARLGSGRDPMGASANELRIARRVTVAGALLLSFLALARIRSGDPAGAAWFLGGTTALVGVATLSNWALARWFSYAGFAGVLLSCFADLLPASRLWSRTGIEIHAALTLCSVYGVVCVLVDWLSATDPRRSAARSWWSAGHLVTAPLLTWVTIAVVVVAVLGRIVVPGSRSDVVQLLGFVSLPALGAWLLISLTQPLHRQGLALLYIWGLTITMFSTAFVTRGTMLQASVGLALAVYAAIVGWSWRNQFTVWKVARLAGWSRSESHVEPTARWLVAAQLILVTLTAAAQLAMVMSSEPRGLRMMGAVTPLMGALAIAALASGTRAPTQRAGLAHVALACFGLFCLYGAWADLDPAAAPGIWLSRLLRVPVVSALLTLLMGTVAPRLLRITDVWGPALRRATAACGAIALASLTVLLFVEVYVFVVWGRVALSSVETSVIAVMFGLMIAGLLATALRPQTVNADLSLRSRQLCVYAAELTGALLALHIAISMPWLMRPEWRPYWPYGVMLLAFLGAAAGELCQRRRLDVLAEPIQRTALLLPIVPFVLMWILATRSDYALVMFLGGLFYLAFGIGRASAWYMLAAAVCGNVALWTLLERTDALNFARHPQLWLIPPAVSVLAAAQLYRDRLSAAQRSAACYGAALVIYVSSTSEVFLHGIGEALWPPMVLITLAVLGALLGVLLQIRAFLVLGTTFVFVSMFTMVMHAQRVLHHVWPWWAFGIGLGIAILVLFAVFEKKRAEMLSLVQRVRQWE